MRALVIGLGKSGMAAYQLLLDLGYEALGVDRSLKEGGNFYLERGSLPHFNFDLVVISPGVHPNHPLAIRARKKGIEVIGEAEFAFRHIKNPVIGITGTNGKTTLTLLVSHILNACGRKARALGNVGDPFASAVRDLGTEEMIVAELSSYQLDMLTSVRLDAAVITSITPDHLDRYASFMDYAKAKGKISDLINPGGVLYVTESVMQYADLFAQGIVIEVMSPDSYLQLTREQGYWRKLDEQTMLFSLAICKRLGLDHHQVLAAIKSFKKPAHRLEFVDEIGGVTFYNDSKGTNPEATLFALKQMQGNVILIAGGLSKGSPFSIWKGPFEKKVKRALLIGEAAEEIRASLEGHCAVDLKESLECAVAEAKKVSAAGDIVLLSPGCASFDQFVDYEDRGNQFKELVAKLRDVH